MRLRLKILIRILVTLILANGILIVYDIKKEIKNNKEDIIIQIQSRYESLNREIDILKNQDKILNREIINLPEKERIAKTEIEYRLRQITVMIYNKTLDIQGSGVTIKYRNKFYILSAGHMIKSKDDILTFAENGQEIGELEIIKYIYTAPEEDKKGDFTKGQDLLLLRPKNKNLIPGFYTELADFEAQAPTEVYIVGNPMGIEDILNEGRIIMYYNNFVYFINHSYFGNSGGGIFTQDGKLLGIVSHLVPIQPYLDVPAYLIHGAVRLDVIREFLEDIE